jgi:hypothetical protein
MDIDVSVDLFLIYIWWVTSTYTDSTISPMVDKLGFLVVLYLPW